MANIKENFKSSFCFIFAIGWFFYTWYSFHKPQWLVSIVFGIIGFYLKGKEK